MSEGNIENVGMHGSMYGLVDSMRHLTKAFEELLDFLPPDFVWPTQMGIGPYSIYVEWGRDDPTKSMGRAVWLVADASGVKANASLHPDSFTAKDLDFVAGDVAAWLIDLTQDWDWGATKTGGIVSSHLSKLRENSI